MNRSASPTIWFWNFLGLAIAVLACGISWSLLGSTNYKLEAANHKLEVNTAVSKVRQVSDELEQTVNTLPISGWDKKQISEQLKEADSELNEINQKILTVEEDNQ